MLTPQQIDELPNEVVRVYEDAETDILIETSRTVAVFSEDIQEKQPSEREKLINAALIALQGYAVTRMAQAFTRSEPLLVDMLDYAVTTSISFDDVIYREMGKNPIPISESIEIQEIMGSVFDGLSEYLKELGISTAQGLPPIFFKTLYETASRMSAGEDPEHVVRNAIKNLARQGVGVVENGSNIVYYPTGHKDRIDVAVRRAVVTEANRQTGRAQYQRAKNMGIDLMELTAHSDARPEHMAWQGRIVSLIGRSGYLSLYDIGYGSVTGFQGANCRHSWFPFFEGFSERAYSEKTLRRYENATVEYNGVTMTHYQATQHQRYLERGVRDWKRERDSLKAAGIDNKMESAKVSEWQNRASDFSTQTGLYRQYEREQI